MRPLRLAVLGDPIEHSLSPALHRIWLDAEAIAGSYDPIRLSAEDSPTELGPTLRHLDGANLTMPLKERAIAAVDALDPSAQLAGAINVVRRLRDGRLEGANTDGRGFVQMLRTLGEPCDGRRIVLLGTGGTARALWASLYAAGASQVLVRGRSAPSWLPETRLFGSFGTPPEGRADLLVSALPFGVPVPSWVEGSAAVAEATLVDVNYRGVSALGAAADRIGRPFHDGWGLFVAQAALSFEWWTGVAPDRTLAAALRPAGA